MVVVPAMSSVAAVSSVVVVSSVVAVVFVGVGRIMGVGRIVAVMPPMCTVLPLLVGFHFRALAVFGGIWMMLLLIHFSC
jgi:hypothetical protein